MKSVNKVILLGNLTRDPELRQTENNKAVCSFGLATNRNWTTETGKKREEPEYHRIVAWEKLAETCHQYLRKGRKVYVEGRLRTRSYTDKDDMKRTVTEIVLDEMVMLDSIPQAVREALEFQRPNNSASPAANSRSPMMIVSFNSLSFILRIARISGLRK
jgi:single-strand DNA-binding protein